MIKKTKKLILLDAHAILHRAYHALPDFSSSKGEPTGALFGLSTMLFSIIKELKPDYIIAAFDLPKPTYRHEAYADYKAGRKKTDNNLIDQFIRARDMFKAFNIPIYEKEGFEADDVLGTICHELKNNFEIEIIIASGDMDTLQLVDKKRVQVYTLKKGIKDTILYDEKAVKERFGFAPKLLIDYKGLRGDPSDNIIGVEGVGEKTATSLITNFGTIEEIYKALNKKDKKVFEKIGIKERMQKILLENKEEAEFSKMLATIRLDVPLNFKIPNKSWREGINHQKIKELFQELDFRSLTGRLNEVLEVKEDFQEESSEEKKDSLRSQIDPQKIKETTIALWLLDSSLTNPTLDDILVYTQTDDFKKAEKIILTEIKKNNLEFLFNQVEKPLIPIISKMQKKGVKVDVKKLKQLSAKYHVELSKIEKEIYREAGTEFNLNSPKQLSEVLFQQMGLTYKGMRKTSTGKYSTKEDVLQKIALEHEIGNKILEYREYQKLLSTYVDTLPNHVSEDGRIHAEFLQTGTNTGRFSSRNPNLQNIPVGLEKGKIIREAFVAEKGFKLLSFDYSQIELRIAAFLAKDSKLIQTFKNKEDIHTAVASEIFEVSPEEVTKEMRRQAKIINFGILYGMGISSLQKGLGTDRKTAQDFYNKYFEKYKGLAKYIDQIKISTARTGFTKTFFGRRRYFEGFRSNLPFIRAQAERMAINAPIQGTSADIIKIAMVKIDELIEKENLNGEVSLILQIHDELIYEVRNDFVKSCIPKIQKIMNSVLSLKETEGVPILSDCLIGNSWGDMKK